MKTDKEKYPEETRYMFYSSILIRLSLVFIFGIPILVFFEIMETYTYLSFFIFLYVLKKECYEYAINQTMIEIQEEMEKEKMENE
ncbi:MAG: hypothetical protein RL308_970 [Bacteroidota bacterium]|jgi:hypothetical protein